MKSPGRAQLTIAVALCALVSLAAWFSRPAPPATASRPGEAVGTAGTVAPSDDVEALRERDLEVPIDGADPANWKGAFYQERGGHRHEAVDIPAPRNTPIHAAEAGIIAKLFSSKAGGLTVYQRDPTNRYIYYYAHLERYADVREGEHVSRGQVLGYVGTSGNAPPAAPHLHFAIERLEDPSKWWKGIALDPYEVYKK